MHRVLIAVLGILIVASLAGAEKFITVPYVDHSQNVMYVDDAIIVNLAASTGKARVAPEVAATGKFGIPALDALATQMGVNKVEALFPNAELTTAPGVPDMSRFYRIIFDSKVAALSDVLAGFSKSALVETAEPIGINFVDFTPNDTYANPGQAFGYQWALEQSTDHDIDAFTAWNIQKGSTTVVLAGLDTGVRYYHKDLGGDNWLPAGGGPQATGTTGNVWINTLDPVDGIDNDANGFVDDHIGWDFVTGVTGCATGEDCSTTDNDPRDFNGHGTHTAGTMAAITNNARGVAGVAGGDAGGTTAGIGNGCKIMCLRIGWSDAAGNGFVRMDFAAQALNYAAAVNNNPSQTAKVCAVNCSWGSSSLSALQTAVQNAVAAGILICKAAGNSNNQTADFLNAKGSDTTMSVAATDSFDVKASFSSYGTWVDVSSPGVDIISTYHLNTDPANDYVAKSSGTSMSAPHVAGLAGLVKSQDPSLTRSQVSSLIKNNTDNIDAQNPGFVGLLGTGRINAQKALAAVAPPDVTPPTVTLTAPNGGESWNVGTVQAITWIASDNVAVTSVELRLDRGNDGIFEELITTVSGNPGSFNWTVTGPATTLAKVQAIARDAAANSASDASNAVFTIVQPPDVTPPTVTVTAPNGGENWQVGSVQNITWTASDNVGVTSINLDYSTAGAGGPFTVIATGEANDGVFPWTVPNTPSTNAFVRVTAFDAASNSASDLSNAAFTISTPPPAPVLHVSNITVTRISSGPWRRGRASVTVVNQTGTPVANATVTGFFNAPNTNSKSAVTGSNGVATLNSDRTKTPPADWCFEVTNVSLAGATYNPSANVVTRACETGPVFEIGTEEPVAISPIQNMKATPNPFNATTSISYYVPQEAQVTLDVYNIRGQKVKTLVNDYKSTGTYSIIWDGTNANGDVVSSGVYFYNLSIGKEHVTKKMTFLK